MTVLVEDARVNERARSTALIREGLSVLSSKWSVGVLLALGEGPRRYHEILAELDPISEKVLTQTLRTMERDGLIARHVHAEVPPRVEYTLTRLGKTLREIVRLLVKWSGAHLEEVDAARARYDARQSKKASSAA